MNSNHRATRLRALSLTIPLIIASQVAQSQENIEEVITIGSRASLQNALQKQRNSDKVVGVIDSDAIGNFADINVSESLRRISGIMVENDQGEGRYVSVRGMNADLNSMTINGVSTAAPEDRRGIMLDGVPTDILDSMTVYKTLTPNLDADTIGGAINLDTISAFKYDKSFARIKAETSYNELTKDGSNPSLSATFTNRFRMESGELGAALILSDQERRIETHNNEMGGWSDVAPNDDYEMRFYDLTRERQGIVLNLDYVTDAGHTFYLHSLHNEYTDIEYRGKWEIRDGFEDNDPVINGNTFTYANTKIDNEARDREEVRTISSMQIGADFEFDNGSTLKAEVFGSRAEQDDQDQGNVIWRSGTVKTPITFDNSNPKKPVLNYASEFYDPASYKLKAFEVEKALTTDRDTGVRFDYTFAMNTDTEVQAGFKYRAREKKNDFNFCGYEPVDTQLLSDYPTMNISAYLDSVHGPAPSSANVRGFFGNLGQGQVALSDGTFCQSAGSFFEFSGDEDAESVPADWQTEEDVMAVYAMATTVTGNASWVYGLRYEDTSTTYRGKSFDGNAFTGMATYDNDYGFLAPSLNVKFDLNDQQVARVGVYRSLVRPGFKESSAGAVIDTEDNQIEGGNTDLDPTTAWNFDLSWEYYLGAETFVGAGVFYKRIEDSIVEVEARNAVLRGRTWDQASTFFNADSSTIYGVEFSYQTAFENGLLFVFNYTHADGETDLPANAASGQRTIPYFKQAADTANLAFGYDKDKWDIRLAANYRGKYLDELGGDALSDRYTSDFMQMDLTVKYQFNEQLLITGSALNLNDRPEFYYFGNSNRLSQYDEYGTTYGLGIRFQF
jgi:TonB-dependent receptor